MTCEKRQEESGSQALPALQADYGVEIRKKEKETLQLPMMFLSLT